MKTILTESEWFSSLCHLEMVPLNKQPKNENNFDWVKTNTWAVPIPHEAKVDKLHVIQSSFAHLSCECACWRQFKDHSLGCNTLQNCTFRCNHYTMMINNYHHDYFLSLACGEVICSGKKTHTNKFILWENTHTQIHFVGKTHTNKQQQKLES